ncbi:MAG: class I SAM-dependent methyltransferase [Nitrospinae bacterium]|nr:class I SAM-dependent methyltransferase [Nitrospinota bacterium]
MATSSIGHVRHVMSHIIANQPQSVLDVGVGFGRWGFLCREMLDVFPGRVRKEQWRARIEGIEIFKPYLQDHQRHIYDAIHIGDARDALPSLGMFDIVIIGDMLEHLSKDDGWGLFHAAMGKANIGLILNLPMGKEWLRETNSENKHEDHLSWWRLDEFADYRPDTYLTKLGGLDHASMFIKSRDYGYARLLEEGESAETAGDARAALRCYNEAVASLPGREEAYCSLANVHLGANAYNDALQALTALTAACPAYSAGRLILANLQSALGQKEAARKNLVILLGGPSISDDIASAARSALSRLEQS